MPLLTRQSSSCKKRLQHQLYLARECPDLVFDISGCEITEIPSGVFSLCKVLQKEVLLVHSNWLSSLKGVGNFADLSGIRILDLHSNRLLTLPDEIGSLVGLQILNLERNRIKALPASIGSLRSLQTLNLRDNRLKVLPDEIGGLRSLRILDISANCLTTLPKQLGHVRTLENLTLDAEKITYPDSGVCNQGTEAVMRFLCSELKIDYCTPSKVLLDVLPFPHSSSTPGFNRCRSFSANESTIADTVLEYENLKEKRRQERLALEQQLEDDQRQQALLLAQAAMQKNHLVQYVAQEQARMHQELEAAHQQKEVEREKLLETLTEAERASSELVQKLLEMNEKARKTEELLELMERERMEAEQSFVVRQEELENIRRKDVLASMEEILERNNFLDDVIRRHIDSQDDVVRKSLATFEESDDLMENVFNTRQLQQQLLIEQLLQEEAVQKEAFEVLQCQKDARHKRVTSQIRLIQQELAELTFLEMEQSTIKLNMQMNVLEEKRKELTALLLQLLEERKKREEELRARLLEMEEQRLANQTDYWLVQYQRLLDAKPQFLVDQEHHVEFQVIRILESAGAIDYLPQFALHRITIETLLQMSNDDLKRIGIRDPSVRQAVIEQVKEFRSEELRNTEVKKESLEVSQVASVKYGFSRQRIPSAPPFTEHDSAEKEEIQARGINSLCAICLDAQSDMLFLNCGHVCTCSKCAELIHECPLDRSEIVQRIHLLPSSSTVSSSAFPVGDDTAF